MYIKESPVPGDSFYATGNSSETSCCIKMLRKDAHSRVMKDAGKAGEELRSQK